MNFPTIFELAALPLLFGQETEDTGGGGEDVAADGGFLGGMWPLMAIMCVVYLIIMMIPRGDQKKQKAMLDNLKKNDRVITAGGIFGTIVTVRQEDPFVTLRVDDSTNTRMKLLKTSISRVVTADEKGEKGADDGDGSSELKTS
ncbi:MAG: preprotein translocase subunit YajC [Planctomycetota bacterium]|nr:preprotein translocase subunit YajC [Planctomycetota bacterium]